MLWSYCPGRLWTCHVSQLTGHSYMPVFNTNIDWERTGHQLVGHSSSDGDTYMIDCMTLMYWTIQHNTYQWPVTIPFSEWPKMITFPAYLWPPIWEQSLTKTWSLSWSFDSSSENDSFKGGPQVPQRLSREPCPQMKTWNPESGSGVPSAHSFPATKTSSTKDSTSDSPSPL